MISQECQRWCTAVRNNDKLIFLVATGKPANFSLNIYLHMSSYTLSSNPNVTTSSLLSCWLILLSTSKQEITINLSWDSIPFATHDNTTSVILSPASFKIISFAMFPSMSKPSWCKLLHLALTHSNTNLKKHRFLPNTAAFSGVKLRFRRMDAI